MSKAMVNDDYRNMLCGSELRSLNEEIETVSSTVADAIHDEAETRDKINELISEVESLAAMVGCPNEVIIPLPDIDVAFNAETDQSIAEITGKTRAFPPLTTTEYIVSALAGSLSVMIDVLLVGTPEVVKIYRGGENFDGSKLTEIIRKIQPDDGSQTGFILKWLSDKCKVPYDTPSRNAGAGTRNTISLTKYTTGAPPGPGGAPVVFCRVHLWFSPIGFCVILDKNPHDTAE